MKKLSPLGITLGILCFLHADSLKAQTWNGGGANSNWSSGGNWATGTAPTNDGSANLIFAGSTRTSPTTDVNWAVNGITFANAASPFALSGSTITIGGSGIINNSGSAQTILNAIVLAANQTWNAGTASLVISGGGVNNNGFNLTLDGSGTSTFIVGISGSGGLVKQGAGTWILTNSNTYTGTTTVTGGVLLLSLAAQLNNTIKGDIVIGDNINTAGSAVLRFANSGTNFGNQIANTSNVTVNSSGVLDFNNNVSSPYSDETIGALTVNGGSVTGIHSLTLTGNLTMTGGTIANVTGNGGLVLGGDVTTNASTNQAAISTALNLNGATRTFNVASGGTSIDLAVTGTVSNGAMIKTGAGSMLLSGTNAFSGGVTLNQGTLIVGNNTALSTGNLVINGGTLAANNNAFTISNAVTIGANAAFTTGTNGFVNAALNGAITLLGTEQLNVINGTWTFGGTVLDGGAGYGIVKTGTGTLVLSASNSFSGPLTVNGGTLRLGIANALIPPSNVTVNGGGTLDLFGFAASGTLINLNGSISAPATLANSNGTGTFAGAINMSGSVAFNGPMSLNGAISGSGNFIKNGAGVVALGGSNNFTGSVTVTTGTLRAGNANALGDAGNALVAAGGAIDLNGNTIAASSVLLNGTGNSLVNSGTAAASLSAPITLGASATTNALNGDLLFSGGISGTAFTLTVDGQFNTSISGGISLGTGGISKVGSGTLTLNSAASYSGQTNINQGVLTLSGSGNLPSATAVTMSTGASLNTNGANVTVGSLSGTGSLNIGSGTFTTGGLNTSGTFAGNIGGSGVFVKTGSGTMVLNTLNTQASTFVSNGVLSIVSQNALGGTSAVVTVSNGAALDMNFTGPQAPGVGSITLSGSGAAGAGALTNSGSATTLGATINLAAPTTIGSSVGGFTLTGSIAGNSTLTVNAAAASTIISGAINLGSGGLTKSGTGALLLNGTTASVYSGTTQVNAGTLLLSNSGGPAIPGALTIGGGTSATVRFLLDSQLAATSDVTVKNQGLLDLNGFSAAFDALAVTGGTVATNGGSLTVNSLSLTGGAITSNGLGTLTVNNDFNFNSGTATLPGQIVIQGQFNNQATATVTGNLSASGMSNNGSVTVFSGAALATGTGGFDNESTLTISGGTFTSNGAITNNASITATGVISGSGGFTNNLQFTQGSGNVTLATTGANTNNGNMTLAGGFQFRLTGANFSNLGSLNLNGALVSGSATLVNGIGGNLSGIGTISSGFANNGGTVTLGAGSLKINNAFTNAGVIQLASTTANLTGGAITNNATIQGFGNVGNNISNAGTIESSGGSLVLGGTVTNIAGGLITADANSKILVTNGLRTNSGVINLTGGVFDNGGFAMANSAQVSGYGTFRVGTGTNGLTNTGTMTFTGGNTTVNGDITNSKTISVAYYPATFTGVVTNNGIFKSTSTSITFAGRFINNGAYISDPSTQNFVDLEIGTNGTLTGGTGDVFNVLGDVINNSTQNTTFDISQAKLTLQGSLSHDFTWTGADLGATTAGYANNFAIGIFEIQSGGSLNLLDGNATPGEAVYVGVFQLDGGLSQISAITGNGANIYYDPTLSGNAYLADGTYELQGGGILAPVVPVPEPSTWAMLAAGFAILTAARKIRAGRNVRNP